MRVAATPARAAASATLARASAGAGAAIADTAGADAEVGRLVAHADKNADTAARRKTVQTTVVTARANTGDRRRGNRRVYRGDSIEIGRSLTRQYGAAPLRSLRSLIKLMKHTSLPSRSRSLRRANQCADNAFLQTGTEGHRLL